MKKEHFRVESNRLPVLRDIHPGTAFYFNNKKLPNCLCIKTAYRSPVGEKHKHVIGAGFGYADSAGTLFAGPLYEMWSLANAKVIPIGESGIKIND